MGALAGLITARTLGKEAIGILAVSFGIGEFGRAISAMTHIPSIVKYHRGHAEGTVYGSSLVVKLVATTVFFGFILLMLPFFEGSFGVPQSLLLFATSVLLAGILFEIGAARLESRNQMVKSNLILASGSFSMVVLVATLALTGRLTLYTSVAATVASNLVMTILAFSFSRPKGRLSFDFALAWDMSKHGIRIVSASLLAQGLLWTDTLMVSHYLGNGEAGVYNVIFQLTFVMATASAAMGVALVPALAKLASANLDTSRGYQRGTVIALSMSVAIAAVYILGGKLILGLYGPSFVSGYTALVVLTLFGISAALTVPAATMLMIHGRAGLLTLLSLGQLVVNIPANFFLIQMFGILGAAVATTSVFIVGTALSWWAVHRATGASPLSRAAIQEVRGFIRGAF